ncbi:MAG: CBS domain-containing protein [Candidatus Electrothrix sp. ATG2]|nr:CBS domain-containing protein [Candidatus Electrothrix sp. ATG2]
MEIRDEFKEIIKEIVENEKEFKMSPRVFLGYFNCIKRTKGNTGRIDTFLESQNVETSPDYKSTYIDGEIVLKHKEKATSKTESDPIQRINILPSANKAPVTITRDSKLQDATTLMLMNNYSQLPVMSNPRSVAGLVTWESIGSAMTNGVRSLDVKDYLVTDFTILKYDTPLLEAIKTVIEKEFALVQKKDKTLSGIVTIADISGQFLILTEPFLLLEQIENLIRLLLDRKFLIEELQDFAKEGQDVESIDDLTFGEYIRLMENPKNWEKLKITIDRSAFIKELDTIRQIRNDIMHFDPEGITAEQKDSLKNMAKFLSRLKKYY